MAEKNLVLGSGKGYSWHTFEPFVRSFVENVSNADLVLFVDDLSDFTRNQLEKVGRKIQGGELKLEPFTVNLEAGYIVNKRWQMFLRYVENHISEYEQILITDTRDVIFQDDIFKHFASHKNYIGYAEDDGDIGGKKYDGIYNWVLQAFGKETADKLSDKVSVCPGTVIGTPDEIKNFIKTMLNYMPQEKDFHGLDQAIFNYVVYNHLIHVENEIFINCQDGEIFSAEWFFGLNPVKIENQKILRGDGGVPSVVHQYDKHELSAAFVEELYHTDDFQFDDKFTDIRSILDQILHLIESKQNKFVLCLFANELLDKTDFKNYGNYLIECWKILLSKNNSDVSTDLLSSALQHLIKSALKDGFYVNQGKNICKCISKCKKNNLTLVVGFWDFFKQSVLKMTKFHLEHRNSFRYFNCLSLMAQAGLTNHEIFYLLQAEICCTFNKKAQALENYRVAIQYQDEIEDKEKSLSEYKKQMRENLPEEIRR